VMKITQTQLPLSMFCQSQHFPKCILGNPRER